jgi:hypothetical protein
MRSHRRVSETGRLLSLAVTVLRDRGIGQPEARIFLASTPTLATLIVTDARLTGGEFAALRAKCKELGFTALLDPDGTAASPVLQQIVNSHSPRALIALSRNYHLDLTAATDDRPFFLISFS